MTADGPDNGRGGFFPLGDVGGLGSVNRSERFLVIDTLPDETKTTTGGPPAGWRYLGLTVEHGRRTTFFFLIAVAVMMIVGRSFQIQMIGGESYRGLAEGNRIRVEPLRSERGIIYDRNGIPLVRNVPNLAVAVVPAAVPDDAKERLEMIGRLAEIVGVMPEEIEAALDAGRDRPTEPAIVADRITHEQAVLIDIESGKWPTVSLEIGTRREYLTSTETPSLSHVLGFEGRVSDDDLRRTEGYLTNDLIGKTGLEKEYESPLRGQYGWRRVEIDARGQNIGAVAEEPPVAGQSLVLAIDLALQQAAESALKAQLRAWDKTRGSVVVLDPRTGEVLALVSEPSFDANLFARGITDEEYRSIIDDPNHPLFPRAWAASLPSGSTFKPVVAAAGLEEGNITTRTSVLSTGGISYSTWFFPDWKAGGHGPTDVFKALAESVNTFFYAVGGGHENIAGLGMEKIVAYARRFGFGNRLGIDLPGEGSGFLPSKEWKLEAQGRKWLIGDTYHLAIGQGDLLVTPLQIASMTAVFANGGRLLRPKVVNAIVDIDGRKIERPTDSLAEQVVISGTIDAIRRGMRQAVTVGSARTLGDLPVSAAAKTGTAQWASDRPTHAWFTAFAPYEDPEIVVTVNIEEGGEGSVTAAPVAKRIFQAYFSR